MKKNPLVQGAIIATLGIIASKILGIIYVIPFYSIIGSKGGALYGYAYSIYAIFLNLSSIGIPLAISRLTSEYNALEQYRLKEKTFKVGKNVIRVLSLISFLSLIIFADKIAYLFIGDIAGGNTLEDVAFVIRIVATAILVVPTLSVTKGYLQGHGYISVPTYSQVIEQLFRVIIIVVGSYVAIKVLDLPMKVGVGIAVFGATIGGLIAYLYLMYKVHKYKSSFKHDQPVSKTDLEMSTKGIILKILTYSIPVIMTSLITSFYTFADLTMVVRTLVEGLKYNVNEAEKILSILSTWGSKLNMIVTSIATGIVTSLIPNISEGFAKNNLPDIRLKINRSLQILLYTATPLTVMLSVLSKPVWTVFYGYDALSSQIFKYYIYISLVSSLLLVLNMTFQFLNERWRMFIYILVGLIVKASLNIPLMYFFENIGLHGSYGAITATILGFMLSIILILARLRKKVGVNYKETFKRFGVIVFACLIMAVVSSLLQLVLPIDSMHRLSSIILIGIVGCVGVFVYILITIKTGVLVSIFGKTFLNKILSKLKIKKVID